jgi:hypothetical protein
LRRTWLGGLLLAAAWLLLPPPGQAQEGIVVPVAGQPFLAELLTVDAEGRFAFRGRGRLERLPAADLVAWGAPVEPRSGVRLRATDEALVQLIDGSLLVADVLQLRDGRLSIYAAALDQELHVPLELLAAVLLVPPESPQRVDELLQQAQQSAAEADCLLLHNGDRPQGTLLQVTSVARRDPFGRTYSVPVVELHSTAGPLQVEAGRVAAIGFDAQRRRGAAPPARLLLGWYDGSLLAAERFQADETRIVVRTACGLEFTAPRRRSAEQQGLSQRLDRLVFVQMLQGKAVYLSDLEPARYAHVPLLSIAWPYQRDRNVLGGPLRVGGRRYFKGLGMHSASQLTYVLEQGASRLAAEIALDDAALVDTALDDGRGRPGSARFRVMAFYRENGQVVRREAYASPDVRAGDAPLRVDVDLRGAVGVSLVVDFGELGDVRDYANWLNVYLVP